MIDLDTHWPSQGLAVSCWQACQEERETSEMVEVKAAPLLVQ